MSTLFFNISAALDDRLDSMSGLPAVAWGSKIYKPVIGTLYLRPTNIQGDTEAETNQDQTIGIYQVDVFSQAGKGKKAALVMADKVADQFKQDTIFAYGGQNVRVINVSGRVISHNDEGWFHYMVEVTYDVFSEKR